MKPRFLWACEPIRFHLIIVAASILVILRPYEVASQEPGHDVEDRELQTYLFAGIRDARLKLHSGECVIRGVMEVTDPDNSSNDLSGQFLVDVAFEGDQFYFNRSEPGWVIDRSTLHQDPTDQAKVNASSMKGSVRRYSCSNLEYSAYWQAGEPLISLVSDRESVKQGSGYFDVRAIGLYSWVEFERGLQLDDLLKSLDQRTVSKIDRSEQDQWVLNWSIDDSRMESEWQLTVNINEGFTPIRCIQRQRRVDEKSGWHVVQSSETQWKEQNQVWVPVRYEMAIQPSSSPSSFRKNIKFDLEWTSINQPITKERWSWEAFGAPDSVGVVDATFGKPRLIRPYKISQEQLNKMREDRSDALHQPEKPRSLLFYIIISVNIIVLCLVLGIVLFRRWWNV